MTAAFIDSSQPQRTLGPSLYPQARACFIAHGDVALAVRVLRAAHPSKNAQAKPMLLLHGHPQSMAMWHRVASGLAESREVVMMDLRGYGDSDRPASGADDVAYSKRVMAQDAVVVMGALGHARFDVLAHDRGARVAHRLALDHPSAVQRLMLLDIAPTLAMYRHTDEAFAKAYWHWFFLIQANGYPEAVIDADPVAYLRACMGSRRADGLAMFAPEALAEYERCIRISGSARGITADYRASAGIDLQHDRADQGAGRRLTQPLRVLWGELGAVGSNFDVLGLWRERAFDPSQINGRALPCSHYIAEEQPQSLLAECQQFFN